jgi:hypothetical protein
MDFHAINQHRAFNASTELKTPDTISLICSLRTSQNERDAIPMPILAEPVTIVPFNTPVKLKTELQMKNNDNFAGEWLSKTTIPRYHWLKRLRRPANIKRPARLIESIGGGVKKTKKKKSLKKSWENICVECLDINLTHEEMEEKFHSCSH